MKYFILIIIVIISFSCSSDSDNVEQQTKLVKTLFRYGTSNSAASFVFYKYNNDGLVSRTEWDQGAFKDGFDIVYDINNNIVSSKRKSDEKFTYDSQGRLIEYNEGFTGVTKEKANLEYSNNTIRAIGSVYFIFSFETKPLDILLELNDKGLITKMTKCASGVCNQFPFKVFDYDQEGNLISIKRFQNDKLLEDIKASYDNGLNPFFGQYKSIYIKKFINTFFDDQIFLGTTSDFYGFPYFKNNITSIIKTKPGFLDETLKNYEHTYDNNGFLINTKIKESAIDLQENVYDIRY